VRKAVFVISLAALFAAAGPIVNAYSLERLYNYYTDSSFTTACGYVDMACGTTYSYGCTTNWRYCSSGANRRRRIARSGTALSGST
jgi:hypothetical protein